MLKSSNKPKVQLTEDQLAQLRVLRENHPWYKIIMANKQDILQWLSHPAWQVFHNYLSEMEQITMAGLMGNHWDKDGRDISDLLRGKLIILQELRAFKDTLMKAEDPNDNGN